MKSKNIAIAGEITPSKTIIPIIEKLKEREAEGKLSFKINKIIGLYRKIGIPHFKGYLKVIQCP